MNHFQNDENRNANLEESKSERSTIDLSVHSVAFNSQMFVADLC